MHIRAGDGVGEQPGKLSKSSIPENFVGRLRLSLALKAAAFRERKSKSLAAALAIPIAIFAVIVGSISAALAASNVGFPDLFKPSSQCIACHNNIPGPSGQDLSIGYPWRTSMMANSARDPYWQAGVRREVMDHPQAKDEIEDTCSTCHMPMARFQARAKGAKGQVFAHLAGSFPDAGATTHALDGVSCTVCHQVSAGNFGQASSFDGGFIIDTARPKGQRQIFGPFNIDSGRQSVMRSATDFTPTEATHIRQSELCATCHTLYTKSLDAEGKPAGVLPEQMPYLEWLHSDFKSTKSCQACHMPQVASTAPITSMLAQQRPGVSAHVFVGGNAFMQRILGKYAQALGINTPPEEFAAAAQRTEEHLAAESAAVAIDPIAVSGPRMTLDVTVTSLTGHKLPTAYPSRRAWLHVVVRDAEQKVVFESGALRPTGAITGNDNDEDPTKVEPHYTLIDRPDQVQIYESVMADFAGRVTTGLLFGTRYLKDNRLLPTGFDKAAAPQDVAVHGGAAQDPDFTGGGDCVRYIVDVGRSVGPWTATVELNYQPVGFRWAENLKAYDAAEPKRFVTFFNDNAAASASLLAKAVATSR